MLILVSVHFVLWILQNARTGVGYKCDIFSTLHIFSMIQLSEKKKKIEGRILI